MTSALTDTNIITVTADSNYQLYFDGVLVADRTSSYNWTLIGSVPLPATTRVIAIAGMKDVVQVEPGPAGIIASDSAGQLWTSSLWRCSSVSVDGWMDVGFNDSGWPYANDVAPNGGGRWQTLVSGVSVKANWIWTNNFDNTSGTPQDTSIYCRLFIGMCDFNYKIPRMASYCNVMRYKY